MRARPLTQGSRGLGRGPGSDGKQELAWMSTNNGVQLISVQPMQVTLLVIAQVLLTYGLLI